MFVKSKHSWRKWILWLQNYHLYVVGRKTKHFNMAVVQVLCCWAALFKLPSSQYPTGHTESARNCGVKFSRFVEILFSPDLADTSDLRARAETTLRWNESEWEVCHLSPLREDLTLIIHGWKLQLSVKWWDNLSLAGWWHSDTGTRSSASLGWKVICLQISVFCRNIQPWQWPA